MFLSYYNVDRIFDFQLFFFLDMRRKSERNKAKGSPEKKVEKPTRRTTRRRGKPSPSPSPEREAPEDNTSNTPNLEDGRETETQSHDTNEQQEMPVSSSDLIKSVLGADEEDSGSVWKVARADASPGEIQKLKLCRQRNISEASDSSSSKKKSNKWPESGEGGMEEVDSVDEQIASSQNLPICENTEDASSSHPGQDSNQEVSEYKENLPETTSANLSDDQTNIDQQADLKDNLPETTSAETLSQPASCEDEQSSDLPNDNSNSIQTTDSRDAPADLPIGQQDEDSQEQSNNETCSLSAAVPSLPSTDGNVSVSDEKLSTPEGENVQSHNESVVTDNQTVASDLVSIANEENTSNDEQVCKIAAVTKESDAVGNEKTIEQEEIDKETSLDSVSNSRDESDTQENQGQSPATENLSTKAKNQSKDHESNASESSDDEQHSSRNLKAQNKEADSSDNDSACNERKNSRQVLQSTDIDENSMSTNMEPEIELSESNIEKDDILEINEKTDDLNVTLTTSKPAKVCLKRSL